jgi:hypothetical protein
MPVLPLTPATIGSSAKLAVFSHHPPGHKMIDSRLAARSGIIEPTAH